MTDLAYDSTDPYDGPGTYDGPVPGGSTGHARRRRGRVTVDVTWSLDDDDAEIAELLGVLLGTET